MDLQYSFEMIVKKATEICEVWGITDDDFSENRLVW